MSGWRRDADSVLSELGEKKEIKFPDYLERFVGEGSTKHSDTVKFNLLHGPRESWAVLEEALLSMGLGR